MSIVFLDTECTGLSLDDDIWEVAMKKGVPGLTAPSEYETDHFFVHHDTEKASRLPHEFRSDYEKRFNFTKALTREQAAWRVYEFTLLATIVGAVPSFDTERLAKLITENTNLKPKWHYHLIDVENVVIGYLAGQGYEMRPPYNSDDLSRRVGVNPEDFHRHSALGDVLWCEAQYEAVRTNGISVGARAAVFTDD